MTVGILPNKLIRLGFRKNKKKNEIDNSVFGNKLGLAAKFFGCRHNNMSRPFGMGKASYRACLQCGARKQFNPETLETKGSFYFPPVIKTELI